MILLRNYIRRIFLLMLLYSTSRLFFYLNNISSFNNTKIIEFIEGCRFDISALFYINIPLLLLLLFPNNFIRRSKYRKLTNILFYGVNIPFIILNNIDIEYFKFTQKRSTIDFFQLLILGEDAKNIIPQYIKDYWLITCLTIIQIWLLQKIKYLPKENTPLNYKNIITRTIIFVFGTSIFIIGARGGLQLKPIKPINAGELSRSQNTALILNTPFCILHSIGHSQLKIKEYSKKKEIDSIYSPLHDNKTSSISKKNIIILIMESYSKEFVGFYNNGIGYTPFLDSLMEYSLVFTNAYANGLKSIEALPAITSSIPTLMDNPFITSDYAQNTFSSIPSLLNREGYNTSLYHGGIRGTMGFYSFSRKAGFKNYFGMEEYNNNSDFDGTWGIYDGPFLNFFLNNLNNDKKPFFSTFFSLSSHPPYSLPKDYIKKYPINKNENIGIRETIFYSDYCMQNFFEKAKDKKWFKNTIFIITADHSSPISYNKRYKNLIGRYAIPLVIFSGDSSLQGINNNIVQHIDIMPTVLELINYNDSYFAFGKSMFTESWAVNFLQNKYRLITDSLIIINKEEKYEFFSDWNTSIKKKEDYKYTLLLKAIKQNYNNRMINNQLLYEN